MPLAHGPPDQRTEMTGYAQSVSCIMSHLCLGPRHSRALLGSTSLYACIGDIWVCASQMTYFHTCTGSLHRLRDGRTVLLSLPGSMDPPFDMPHSPCTAFPQTQRSNLVVSGSSSTGIPGSAGLAVAALPSGGAATSSPKSEQSNILSAPEHVRHCCPVCPSPQAARQAGSSSGASPSGAYIRQECVMARASAACCPVDSAADAHFMAMAAKLIYEDPRVIADWLEHRCSCLHKCSCL